MGDVAQKLTIQAELQGAQQTSQGLQQIADAQKRVQESAGAGALAGPRGFAPVNPTAAGAGGGEPPSPVGDETNLKMKDFSNLLGLIDPRLQSVTQRLIRAGSAFGDLGTKTIDFAAVGKGLVETLTKLGPALGLLAAGGAAAAGFGLLISKIQEATRAAEALKESVEKIGKAQTQIGRERIDSVDEIVAARDKMRKTPSFDATETAAVEQTIAQAERTGVNQKTLEDLKGLLPGLKGASNIEGGGEFTFDDLVELARQGHTIDPSKSAGWNVRRARSFLRKPETISDRERINARDPVLDAQRTTQATEEATSTDPTRGMANLDQRLEKIVKQYGADLEKVRSAVQDILKEEDDLRTSNYTDNMILPVRQARVREANRDFGPAEGLSIDQALKSLYPLGKNSAAKQKEPSTRPDPPNGGMGPIAPLPEDHWINANKKDQRSEAPVINNIHNEYNSRKIAPFARGQRQARVNGESRARGMEMV